MKDKLKQHVDILVKSSEPIYFYMDFDGTLTQSYDVLYQPFIPKIAELVESGVGFGVATGRSYIDYKKWLEFIPVNLPHILDDGRVMYDLLDDSLKTFSGLSKAYIHELHKIASSMGFLIVAEDANGYYANGRQAERLFRFSFGYPKEIVSGNILDIENCTSIYLIHKHGKKIDNDDFYNEILFKLNCITGMPIETFIVYDSWIKLRTGDSNKAKGIMQAIKNKYAHYKRLIFIGDNVNDIPAFEYACLSISVDSGVEMARAHADIILTREEITGLLSYLTATKTATCPSIDTVV